MTAPTSSNADTSEKPSESRKDGPALTREKIARLIGGSILVMAAGKEGAAPKPMRRKLAARDILAYRVEGTRVLAVTIDGRKHEAELAK